MNKLWQTGSGLHPLVEQYTVGNDPHLDLQLLPFDIQGTLAHAKGLMVASIIDKDELLAIKDVLDQLYPKALAGDILFPPGTEDCHSYLENYLVEKLGDCGKKIHAGRSRNDQVLTALRLYQKSKLLQTTHKIAALCFSLGKKAEAGKQVNMPGFSHGRQGMVISLELWFSSWQELLQDDGGTCKSVIQILDKSPLGAGAGFGNSLGINRQHTGKSMGFKDLLHNPLAAMGRRGKDELQTLQALSQVMTSLGKFASELLLFTSESYGFFSLPAEFLSGSSMMPNKANYDLLELVRGNCSMVNGYMAQVAALIGSLGSGYHRDFQLTKEALFNGLEITIQSIDIMKLTVDNLEVDAGKISKSIKETTRQTEAVEKLVAAGVPFREAYQKIKLGS